MYFINIERNGVITITISCNKYNKGFIKKSFYTWKFSYIALILIINYTKTLDIDIRRG